MIWSSPARNVAMTHMELAGQQVLHESHMINARLAEQGYSLPKVSFFKTIDLGIDGQLKPVTSYVTLSEAGRLLHADNSVYGINSRAATNQQLLPWARTLHLEAHALAEDTSFRNGLFDPGQRADAEILILGGLHKHFQSDHARERIKQVHSLEAEAMEVENDFGSGNRDMLLEELAAAITALEARVE